jgi:hypothetical protein
MSMGVACHASCPDVNITNECEFFTVLLPQLPEVFWLLKKDLELIAKQ